MSVGDELKDPWGWVVAGVSGGVGWAVLAAALGPVAIPVGVGIGAAVLGTKVALGARSGEGRTEPGTGKQNRLPRPPAGSPQGILLTRARSAQKRIAELADGAGDAWLTQRIGRVDDEVDVVNGRLSDLAGRVTVADQALASARPQELLAEYARVTNETEQETDAAVKAERQRVLDALESQVESVQRLDRLRDTLLARMQTAVVGLEGLGSRMAELVALGDDPVTHDRSSEVLAQLTGELDNVRAGLAEAEELSRGI